MIAFCVDLLLHIVAHMAVLYAICTMCGSGQRPQKSSASKKHKKSGEQVANSHSSRFAKLTEGSSKSSKRKRSNKSPNKDNFAELRRSRRSAPTEDGTQSSKSLKRSKRSAKSPRSLKALKCVPATLPALAVEPSDLRWTEEGGTQTIHISNLTNERQAMKVKCSDNYLYSVDPVYTFVEPGSRISVEVVRNNGALKLDEMVFLTTKAKANDHQAKSLFAGKRGDLAAIVPLLSATA